MKKLKSYECRIDNYFNDGSPLTSIHIGLTPAKARYSFYREHSECLTEYSECFKYIKSKTIGIVRPEHFFTDVEQFHRVCKSRQIEFAYQGMKIDVAGKLGCIVGANSHNNLEIFFQDTCAVHNCHPTWETTYYNHDMTIIKDYKKKANETNA